MVPESVMKDIFNLTIDDWAMIFDVRKEEIPKYCVDIINSKDFRYSFFSQSERDKIILDMIKKIDFKKYTISGVNQKERWEKGWQEIYDNFIDSGCSKSVLIPQYNKDGMPIRLYGDYVRSYNNSFENNFVELIRAFVFYKYMNDKDSIYEFGCGSCYNLMAFAEMASDKYYYGCDWVPQPKKIIEAIRDHFKFNMEGGVFDMFEPPDIDVRDDSVAVTIGSLEQLGINFGKFMDFLLAKPFSRYVHLNSILELYNIDNNITDYLTYRFETKRNYCNGFFTNLRKLESKGIIKIIKMSRVPCGGLSGDGYSITVWEKI